MSTVLLNSLPSTTADVLSSTSIVLPSSLPNFPLPQSLRAVQDQPKNEQTLVGALNIVVPDFGIDLKIPLTDITSEMNSGRVLLEAALDSDSRIVLKLRGNPLNGEDKFYVLQVDLSTETTTKLAISDFVLTTIRASLGLANEVNLKLPELELDLRLRFSESLLGISELLRRRQIAYRLMVIEKAIGHRFDLPLDISGEDVEHIALVYHAIVDRSFEWPIETSTVFLPANGDSVNLLIRLNQMNRIDLGPSPQSRTIFGLEVSLGNASTMIEEAFLENFEEALDELNSGDGHPVAVQIRSRIGRGKVTLPDAPRLPHTPWDPNIQYLIDLEEHLDARLVGRYNALAAATLNGLSENQKAEITARSGIGEAFRIEPVSSGSLENF